MTSPYTLLGTRPIRRQITVPIATNLTITIRAALIAAGVTTITGPAFFRINGLNADGTTRPAFKVAGPIPGTTAADADFDTHGHLVAAGVDFLCEPTDVDIDSLFRAASGAAFTANIVVFT